jgi:hypothetical protein
MLLDPTKDEGRTTNAQGADIRRSSFVLCRSDSAASANLCAVLAIDTDDLARYDRLYTDVPFIRQEELWIVCV